MPRIKDKSISCDAPSPMWDAILRTPGARSSQFSSGELVRTKSGGPMLEVVRQEGSDVLCQVGARQVTLPCEILTSGTSPQPVARRGRPVNRALAPTTVTARVIPGALFDTAELAQMHDEYEAASRRLNLEGKPQLARAIAIAILRSAAARH